MVIIVILSIRQIFDQKLYKLVVAKILMIGNFLDTHLYIF